MAPADFNWDQDDAWKVWADIEKAARAVDGQTFIKKQAKCYVCGIGAAVCSAARLFDDCSVYDIEENLRDVVGRFFDTDQQHLIENTFEQNKRLGAGLMDERIAALKSDTARLKAIFQNIIDNKGTFVPSSQEGPTST